MTPIGLFIFCGLFGHPISHVTTASRDMMTDGEESWKKAVLVSSRNVPSFVWGTRKKREEPQSEFVRNLA